MLRIEKIQLKDLSDFTESKTFSSLENLPISSLRILSYSKNKYSKQDDVFLYMAFIEHKLVGYRTLWRDIFYISNKDSVSFGWLSGTWVNDEYRRTGISTKLFNEAYKDWNGKLMVTNHAFASKKLFDKTNLFRKTHELKGTRFYLRFCLADILPKKKKIFEKLHFGLKCIDAIGNIKFTFFKSTIATNELKIEVKTNEKWNDGIDSFLGEFKVEELFKRGEDYIKWIQSFPWIKTGNIYKEEADRYYFSLYAKHFENNYFTFYHQHNLKGFIWLNIKEGHLKITYAYFEDLILEEIVNFIIKKCLEENIKTVLIYNKKIEQEIHKRKIHLYKRDFYQSFFATKSLVNMYPEIIDKKVQSGDGDMNFT